MGTTEQPNLSPRVAQAVDIYLALPEGERSYKAVAEEMKISVGRSADYVRKGLTALGQENMLPRGGNGGSTEPTPTSPAEMMQAEVAKLQARITESEARMAEAKQATEAFDAEAYRAEREQVLAQQVKDAQAALKAWRDDIDEVASNAAEAQTKALTERATTVQADSEQTVAKLREQLTGYTEALELIQSA